MSGAARRLLAALAVIALAAVPLVVTGSYYQFMLVVTFIYIIVATGLNLLAGYAGQFSLGHAGLFAVGAYTTALASKALGAMPALAAAGLHVWLGMGAGVLLACLFGAILAYPALRVQGPYLAMVTVAYGWVIWKVLLEWTPVTGGELGITAIPRASIGPLVLDTQRFYYLALALALASVALQRNLVQSSFGRKIQALKHSEVAAASVGIDVLRTKVIVFVLSAAFAGLGGVLFAHQQNFINPDNFKFFDSVFFLLAILFGGAGTFFGPVVGAATLTFLPELLHNFDRYRLIVYGFIILFTLYFLPRGVCGGFRAARPERPGAMARPGAADEPEDATFGAVTAAPVPTRGQEPALEVRGVSKAFGGVRALAAVSLSVAPGTIHALIGPNGAGKTTLLNVVSGMIRPDAGEIRLGGAPFRPRSLDRAARAGVARTFQTVKLFGDMSVLEHVLVGLERHYATRLFDAALATHRARRDEAQALRRARNLLAFVGLEGAADMPAGALPYGHRRLLELARALAVGPHLLLLDEPAAGLVAEEIAALDRLIVALRRRGTTILLVEHHMDLVMSISDAVTVLDYGMVIAQGVPDRIQEDARVIEAYLGPPMAVDADALR